MCVHASSGVDECWVSCADAEGADLKQMFMVEPRCQTLDSFDDFIDPNRPFGRCARWCLCFYLWREGLEQLSRNGPGLGVKRLHACFYSQRPAVLQLPGGEPSGGAGRSQQPGGRWAAVMSPDGGGALVGGGS